MTYLINLLSVLVYYVIIDKIGGKQSNKIFFVVVTIHAILFRALANPYNYVDTGTYALAFDHISSYSFREAISLTNDYAGWGVGYVFTNWLIGQFTQDAQVLFAVMAILGLTPVFFFMYKTSKSFLFSVVIYLLYPMFFVMGFGVIRQHVAVGFILLALYNIENFKYSILWALLALSFHTSACVFFPFYVWKYINRDTRHIGKSILLIVAVAVVLRSALGEILMHFSRYQHLAGKETDAHNIVPVVFIGSLLLLLLYSGKYKSITSIGERNLWSYMLYGFSMSLAGIGENGMGRMTLYFMYVFPVAITLLGKYRIEKPLYAAYKYVMLGLVIYLLLGSYSHQPYAYSFYWERVTRTW